MEKSLKVFIASPNDVEIERKVVVEICKKINSQLKNRIELEPVLWEHHNMDFYKNPQENINIELKNSDIYIIILWNKIGSSVPGLIGEITKEKDITGTQYEIEYILKHKRESIYFYFKRKELKIDIDNAKYVVEQKEKLNSFLKKIGFSKNTTKYSYQEFKNIKEFKEKIYSLFRKELKNRFNIKINQFYDTNIKYEPNPGYYMALYAFIGAFSVFLYNIH